MSAQRRKKQQTFRHLILLLIIVPFVYYFTINIRKISSLSQKTEAIKQEIAQEEQRTRLLEEDLEKIGTPAYYEYLARKLLGYIYPGEKVLIVTDSPSVTDGEPQDVPAIQP